MVGGLEHLAYEGRLRGVGVVQPGEEKAPGKLCFSFSVC